MALGELLYVAEHQSPFPYPGPWHVWLEILRDTYARVDQVRICPATRNVPIAQRNGQPDGSVDTTWYWGFNSGNTNDVGSYSFNGWLYAKGWINPQPWGIADYAKAFSRVSMISHPALTPVFCDAMWVDTWPETNSPPFSDLARGTWLTAMGRIGIARHGNRPNPIPTAFPTSQKLPGAINVGFFDGHSQTVPLENLWTLYWHNSWQVPDPRPR